MRRPKEQSSNVTKERLVRMTEQLLSDARKLRRRMDHILRYLQESRCLRNQDVEDGWRCAA